MTSPKKRPVEPKEPPPPSAELWTHPLLPGDGEKPPPKVLRFYVTRRDEKTGHFAFAPEAFGRHDLLDPMALFERFGGGHYWIRGQDGTGFVAPFGVWPIAGAPKPLAPIASPEAPPAPAVPTMPMNAAGGFDMGAVMLMFMQGQQAQQAENTKLMGTIITAVLGQRQVQPGETLSEKLLTALVAKGSPNEASESVKQTMAAWKEGLGQGTQLAQIAQEAAAAGNPPQEPSGLDKALDTIAPLALNKMVDKVMG